MWQTDCLCSIDIVQPPVVLALSYYIILAKTALWKYHFLGSADFSPYRIYLLILVSKEKRNANGQFLRVITTLEMILHITWQKTSEPS